MALTITSRGTGTHNTGATTLVPGGRSATLAAGSLGVFCIAVDNAGSAGSATISPASWTDAKGNVWTRRQNALYDNGAASAGIEMAIYTAPITVALLTTDAGTITWDGGVSPVAKAWTWYEVIPSAGNYAEYQTGGTIAGATAANAQVVTATIAVGDGMIAGYFSENVAAVTGDSDSTNGSWTAQQTATIGSTTSGVRIATQQKVQTTTPSTQSYDVTVSSQDRIAGYIAIHEASAARTGSFTATGGGVSAAVSQKGAQSPIVATGGGVAATAGIGGRQVGIAATGAGVLTWDYTASSVENHDGSFTATGGGVTVLGATSNRAVGLSVTGGGVSSVVAAAGRVGVFAATGAGVAAITQTTARSGVAAATGGGVLSASVLAARLAAALMSGGGVLASVQTTSRLGLLVGTGGGSASIAGTQGGSEDHSGSFSAAGGGVWSLSALADHLASIASTGGGAASAAITTSRFGASLSATGGGRVVVVGTSGAPSGQALPDDLVVTVGFAPGPTVAVSLSPTAAPVALRPTITAEVTLE